MPIYEYRCNDCHQLFEEWCRHIEDENVQHNCPICRGQAQRLVSNTSFALKGSGWYVTEYGSHKGISDDSTAKPASTPAGSECQSPTAKDTAGSGTQSASAPASPAPASPVTH